MSSDSHHIGKLMIWTGWAIFLGLLTIFFNDMLSEQHNPNQDVTGKETHTGVREVELTRNKSGHYVSSGFINGNPVVFLVDTGASDVAIPAHVAKRIGLQGNQPLIYQTANGAVRGFLTNLDSISIGNIKMDNIRGGINPSMKDEYILLGMSFLKYLEFTQRDKQLILRQYPGEK